MSIPIACRRVVFRPVCFPGTWRTAGDAGPYSRPAAGQTRTMPGGVVGGATGGMGVDRTVPTKSYHAAFALSTTATTAGPWTVSPPSHRCGQDRSDAVDRLDLLRNDAGRVLLPDGHVRQGPGLLHQRLGDISDLSHVAVAGHVPADPRGPRREKGTAMAGPPPASPVGPVPAQHALRAGTDRRHAGDKRAGCISRPA